MGLYNVERFLKKKCLDDLRNQTYQNLEIILVDDGSTDGTSGFVDELSNEDLRIRVIHKENGGVGSARNAGLETATGEFVYFCDIDDDLHLDLIERCVSLIENKRADMLIFGFNVIYSTGIRPAETVCFQDKMFYDNKELKKVILDELLDILPCGNGFVWNKFYRRDFIEHNHFRFGDETLQQDEVFNMRIYPKLDRLFVSSDILYDYYIYENGNNRSRYIPNRIDIYRSIFHQLTGICKEWGILDNHCKYYLDEKLYKGIAGCLLDNLFRPDNPNDYKEKKREFKRILNMPDINDCIMRIKGTPHIKGLKSPCYHKMYRLKWFEGFVALHWIFSLGDKVRDFLKKK